MRRQWSAGSAFRRAIVVVGLAAVILLVVAIVWHRTPRTPPPPTAYQAARVRAYYVARFAAAQTITVRAVAGARQGSSRTITRRDHASTFARLAAVMRDGLVKPYPCQCRPVLSLEVVDAEGGGHTVMAVAHYLLAEGQPYARTYYFYPLLPGNAEADVGIQQELDEIMRQAPTPIPRSRQSTPDSPPTRPRSAAR